MIIDDLHFSSIQDRVISERKLKQGGQERIFQYLKITTTTQKT